LVGAPPPAPPLRWEKEVRAPPPPGVFLGGKRGVVVDLVPPLPPPLRLQGRYIHDYSAIMREDPGLEGEVPGLGDRDAVDVMLPGDGADGGDLVVARPRSPEGLEQAREAAEDAAVAT